MRHCVPAPPLPNIRLFIININVADPDPHVLGLLDPDPDPLVRGIDPDSDPSITKQI